MSDIAWGGALPSATLGNFGRRQAGKGWQGAQRRGGHVNSPVPVSALQAHMQARFVILRVLLEAGEGLVTVTPTTGADGRPDARVRLDRNKIRSVGRPALERFLRRLQVSGSPWTARPHVCIPPSNPVNTALWPPGSVPSSIPHVSQPVLGNGRLRPITAGKSVPAGDSQCNHMTGGCAWRGTGCRATRARGGGFVEEVLLELA